MRLTPWQFSKKLLHRWGFPFEHCLPTAKLSNLAGQDTQKADRIILPIAVASPATRIQSTDITLSHRALVASVNDGGLGNTFGGQHCFA